MRVIITIYKYTYYSYIYTCVVFTWSNEKQQHGERYQDNYGNYEKAATPTKRRRSQPHFASYPHTSVKKNKQYLPLEYGLVVTISEGARKKKKKRTWFRGIGIFLGAVGSSQI